MKFFAQPNEQYSLLYIFQARRMFFLRLGFSTPSQKSRFEISQEYPIRIVQAPWMFCHVDTVLLRVGVCSGKHCALCPSAQSINPMLLCCYCICVFMTVSLFSACRTSLLNFGTLNLHKTR